MSGTTETPRPKHLLLVGIIALIWNLVGVAMFWMQISMGAEQLTELTEAQRRVYEATPVWLNLAFAVGVFAGVLGAIGLLARKRWAVTMFFVSLLAVLAQMIGAYVTTPAWEAYGAGGLVMPIIVIVIALLLWRYALRAAERDWLR